MKYSIFDACFSEAKQNSRGMSACYLAWELSRHKILESKISDSDCILATCQSTEATDSIKLLRKKYPNKIIICGGASSTSPHSLGKHCDVVCVGDGQKFLSVLFERGLEEAKKLPNAWIDGESRRVSIDQSFPWDMPPIQAEDGAYRVWCGRGCKNKCKFCQTGWAYVYSENPSPKDAIDVSENLIKNHKNIAYLSNDVSQHSFYKLLPPTQHGSYSVNYLKKSGELPPARQIRLGVEGVSERLRRSVSKPISTHDLIGCTKWLNDNHKSVRWFMISGLPGETKEDWLELREILQQWKVQVKKGVLALSFTAFCPDPATPLAQSALSDDYWLWFCDFREWFFGGKGWSNRIKLMMPQQPEARIKKAMLSMGLSETQLREGGHMSPNNRLIYPYADKINKSTGQTLELVE
jgi:radical SAM superfamily enzyme YgiQ (UPF0313 family)